MAAPSVDHSTRDERLAYVRERYQCMADCDLCGLCHLFHGASPEQALADYIEGRQELKAVLMSYRRV